MTRRTVPDPQTTALAVRIGRRIRALRRDRGLTQFALAERIGLSRIYVGEIERGIRDNPTLSHLRRIAAGLGVPVRELLPPDDDDNG